MARIGPENVANSPAEEPGFFPSGVGLDGDTAVFGMRVRFIGDPDVVASENAYALVRRDPTSTDWIVRRLLIPDAPAEFSGDQRVRSVFTSIDGEVAIDGEFVAFPFAHDALSQLYRLTTIRIGR